MKDSELLTYLSTLFKQGVYWDVEKKVKYIEFAKEQILTLKDRLEELVLAAKTQLDIQSIIFNVSKNGGYLKSVSTLYSENDEVLAWHVLVSK
ncbi:hypothetical protein [Shewanella woodyi]|uniref:hypothetical protein n=1 Tax=Shewanella woodyi TaxID=60961 RepID=UPI0037499B73